jgi:DNA-binding FadR family transcriptional regulator
MARSAHNGKPSKLAARVAGQIVNNVIAQGWPVGEVIGSEQELLKRFDVSRAVFREAVRLVEHQQVAQMRRGPGGGLVVTEPTLEGIIDAAVIYLYRVGARLDEVFEARHVLEDIVTELAPSRLDEEGIAQLRRLIEQEGSGEVTDPRALHSLLASITGNPALELFVDILNRASLLYLRDRRAINSTVMEGSARAHAGLVEAVIAGDGGLARRRMRKHLEAEVEFLRRGRFTRQVLPHRVLLSGSSGHKRAEGVAREIFHAVAAGSLQPGHRLGSEADLMERYGVSRAVLRESVRLLEHHHIATMRRGPRGGLFVDTPQVAAVSDVVALYLARRGIDIGAFAELRIGVETALVDLTVDRLDPSLRVELEEALQSEVTGANGRTIHGLHVTIARLSGNRALEFVALVLIGLTRLYQDERQAPSVLKGIGDEVHRTHEGIAAAIQAGDSELARRRMRRHLEQLAVRLG